MNKSVITIMTIVLLVVVFNVPAVHADLVWDGGYHVFSEGSETYVAMLNDASADILGGTIYEFYMYNNTTADITGGEIGQLLCYDTSSVFVYEPSVIDLIKPFETATVDIYGGTITTVFTRGSSLTNVYGGLLDEIEATDLSMLSLYVESYELDPTGGTFGDGLLTGTWLYGGNFTINLVLDETIDHINFVPEPTTIILFGLGSIIFSRIS